MTGGLAPSGWVSEKLSNLSYRVVDGSHTPPPKQTTGKPMLSAKNISDGKISLGGRLISEEAFLREDARTKLRSGDVLLTIVGSIGRSAVVPASFPPFTLQRSVAVIKPIIIPPKFLMLQLRSPRIQRWLQAAARGTAQKGVYLKSLGDLPILVPPLGEQLRIEEKTDKLLSDLDAGVAALERAQANLKLYREAVLKAAIEGRLTHKWRTKNPNVEPASDLLGRILKERRQLWENEQLGKFAKKGKVPPANWKQKYREPASPACEGLQELPRGWTWALTDSLFGFVTSGSRGWAKYYSSEGQIFLRIGNLDHASIGLDLEKLQRVRCPDGAEGARTSVQSGDVLISITADVGMVGLVASNLGKAYVNQHIALARPVPGFSRAYLSWFLAAKAGGQRQFISSQRGMTKQGLGLDDIRSVLVPLPPLEEQKAIVADIERHFSLIDNVEGSLDRGKRKADGLRQAILKRAFEGQLVSRNPEDESAEILLERIRVEREKGRKKKLRAEGRRRANKSDK